MRQSVSPACRRPRRRAHRHRAGCAGRSLRDGRQRPSVQ